MTSTRADDTELFIYDFNKAGDFRPKVLLIFDNSGSMADTMEQIKEAYNPATAYPALSNDPDTSNTKRYIYFSTDGSVPAINSNKRFSDKLNACATSKVPLANIGYFQSQVWTYEVTSGSPPGRGRGSWYSISGYQENNIDLVDCKQDVTANNPANPYTGTWSVGTGYPVNKTSNNQGSWFYTAATRDSVNASNTAVVLYSANYIRWYYGPTGYSIESRLRIAKDAVKGLISSAPGVDFGLAIFNRNDSSSTNGGRVVRDILGSEITLSNGKTGEQDLLDRVEGLTASTNTPLCETLSEAYRFFGGRSVVYGLQGGTRDTTAESPTGTYQAPYDNCSNNGYVIYITDGEPTQDGDANTFVQGLINTLSSDEKAAYGTTVTYGSGNRSSSYLAALAGYMKHKDVNAVSPGTQTVTTFTVGFGDEAISGAGNLLAETARRGGGVYYPATNASALSDALKASLLAILRINTSLVSPAIASNNFDRTRSLNNIYYAMFEPDDGPRWRGNLKKLIFSPDGYVADSRGLPAIKFDGTIIDSAQTFWSSGRDGNVVAEGGAQEMLAGKSNRSLYVINNAQNRLDQLTKANLVTQAGSEAALMTFMQAVTTTELDSLINWTKGLDVDDEDFDTSTLIRAHIMGDPLHSRPLVLNYGPQSGNPTDAPDLRILFGTNAGFLHMFKDMGSTIDESWAAIPYEFMANQKALRLNAESAEHIYGVDSSPVALIKDANRNGVLKSSESDFVWVFTGLRSGGKAYYAFNVSSPDTPTLKWRLNSLTTGFGELGLTWSVPEVAFVPGVSDPVLIFAGGYDVNKSVLGLGTSDSMGRGIYIVNADTGALIFSATPAATSTSNLRVTGMTDSMPGSVATLDSDGDGKVDRIYVGDTGGNIWRMDLPGTNKSDWSVFKFASLGSDVTQADDRRFFTQPIVVRTINKQVTRTVVGGNVVYSYQDRPFDAVLIGSGDRNRPSSEATVRNGYFMLRDYDVVPRAANAQARSPILITDLYDVTSDPLSAQTNTDGILATKAGITTAKGWVNWLNEPGEKSMGAGVVLQGKLYFTSFLPQVQSFQQCTIQSIGAARQYMVDMHYGSSFRYVVDLEGNQTPERYVEVQNKVADDLVVHAGDDAKIRIIGGGVGEEVILKDEGDGEPERCTGAGECNQGAEEAEMDMSPKKIYLYEGEAQ
ncbi:pilus assembly protein [Aeromonas caviae]|uniref:pilus assembly protein n=1 Tax=Aeromonas TaxID=642 RepID=UPI00228159DE|nr:PilC/PilY family type IV pilus protein [Aeromonas caviae]MCY9812651.1 PilC/PilY family type IV pilus protein [Aeromonas caviae]